MFLLILFAVAGIIVKIFEQKNRRNMLLNSADLLKFLFFFIGIVVGIVFAFHGIDVLESLMKEQNISERWKTTRESRVGWAIIGCVSFNVIAIIVSAITLKIYYFARRKMNDRAIK